MSLKEVLKQLGIKLIGWVKSNCVNNLLSDRADLPLAAAQGKVIDEKISSLNSNISTKINGERLGYGAGNTVTLKNKSALVVFGKTQYNQSSILIYDNGAVQPLVNPSADTFTVKTNSDGTITITSAKANYSAKLVIYFS